MSWSIIFSGSSARSRSALMLALASWAMRPRTVCFSTMRSCLSVSAGDRCWSGLRRSEAAAPSTAAASDLRRPDQLRAAGTVIDADRFDGLAKVALSKQISYENEARSAEPMITSQNDVVDKLKTGLVQMREKLEQLRSRRDQLVARAKSAEAQSQVQGAISSINVLDPTTEVARFEDKVGREEARVAGQAEIAASSLDAQFEDLETDAAISA